MLGLNLSLSSNRPPPFNPIGLFRGGEAGVWFDPGDFSTLFQDTAGTVPVTDVEQPVGLMLDKSRGGRGPNLTPPTNQLEGWVGATNNTLSIDGGGIVSTNTSNTRVALRVADIIQPGVYEVEIDLEAEISSTAATTLRVAFSPSTAMGSAMLFPSTMTTIPGEGRHQRRAIVTVTDATHSGFLIGTNASSEIQAGSWIKLHSVSVRRIDGNHATQPTATSRPVLKQDGNGKHYLHFDGVDDWLVTPTITPGTDKVQVFAGVRRLRNVSAEIIAETGNDALSNGAFYLVTESTSNRYGYSGRGNRAGATDDHANLNFFPPPDTAVLTATQDINGNTPSRLRRNAGAWSDSVSTTFGGGNFLDHPLYIGRRSGTTFPFNGHLYSLIVRFGSNLPIGTVDRVERFINRKTSAY